MILLCIVHRKKQPFIAQDHQQRPRRTADAESRAVAPGGDKGFLGGVLGQVEVPEDGEGAAERQVLVAAYDFPVRLVPGGFCCLRLGYPGDQLCGFSQPLASRALIPGPSPGAGRGVGRLGSPCLAPTGEGVQ